MSDVKKDAQSLADVLKEALGLPEGTEVTVVDVAEGDVAVAQGEESALSPSDIFLPMDEKVEVERRVIDRLVGYALAAGSVLYAGRHPLAVAMMGTMIGQSGDDLSALVDETRSFIYTEKGLKLLEEREREMVAELEKRRLDAETQQPKMVSDEALLAATSKMEAN